MIEKGERKGNIKKTIVYEKKLKRKSGGKIADYMKKNWRKNMGGRKKKNRKCQMWQKLEKM